MYKNIPYKSFCWVIGTTSFRTAQLNFKIEQQLSLLNKFYNLQSDWHWDNALQEQFYNFMQDNNFLSGDATRKDKDAREKTSGLVNIGLINSDRTLTNVGKKLLSISEKSNFNDDNIFNISRDSFIYFKQLLKMSICINDNYVRPYIILVRLLIELGYLNNDELTFLVPLIVDEESFERICKNIKSYRLNKANIDDIIFDNLLNKNNYKEALQLFLQNPVDKDLICTIGMNRKSRQYDKNYYDLYLSLYNVFLNHNKDYESLLEATNSVKQKTYWKNFLFKNSTIRYIRKYKENSINIDNPFTQCKTEEQFKSTFFKYLHVFKAKATLLDYFDLNRRYFNLTETLIFKDSTILLDTVPKFYFMEIKEKLSKICFSSDDNLYEDVPLDSISNIFNVDINNVYKEISKQLGITLENSQQVKKYIENERLHRFSDLINNKFPDRILIELLSCFEERNDKRIEYLVTDDATIPTIFEYILAIIWYKVSEKKGNILDFMKLSLDANLLPKSHAAGGSADIVYHYSKSTNYPEHSLLIEATLSDKTNQRRMEMEPVSRHLGDHRINSDNPFDYSLFISTYLDANVINDFRYRKIIPYIKGNNTIDGMKIIPLDTHTIKNIIRSKLTYSELYTIFDDNYNKDISTQKWHLNLVQDIIK